ncbi:BTB/POZ domain-containing protein At2g13690-like [Phragmites australis]|uniref:BTB/POZ domain-containing protein At2g13690-like n=1 Tax=Phragmites australis TaxID=29695 RepID=UPI002D77F950|nr:BTB/POZ domain-containing protein At2g13690-like [Phragmites australis]
MAEGTHHTIRRAAARPRGWCCSFAGVPQSPEHRALPASAGGGGGIKKLPPKSPLAPSFHSSPSSKLAGLIDPRRILSPGRVSPIDPEGSPAVGVAAAVEEEAPREQAALVPFVAVREEEEEEEEGRGLDLRLCLRGRDGRCVVMELDSAVLCESSAFFADMVPDASGGGGGGKRIEVDGVENLEAFKEAVELMFEPDAMRWLARAGVSRAIGVLEVSSSIVFDRGIESCLKYIEAVPWSENEEEKLKNIFARCTLDEAISKDVLARLQPQCRSSSEDLIVQVVESVTSGTNSGARKEMQSLVSGLLCKSSVYQKDLSGLNKGSLYKICHSCLNSVVELFKEDSEPIEHAEAMIASGSKPMIERVSKQTENLNWLFDILVNNDMAEEFVELWAKQDELNRMHEQASPMFRYELSRISASVFISLGKGRIQCSSDLRSQLFCGWFRPMLMDFGWLQRCSKGLDVRILEENLGQALLTLPLHQQQSLFEEWFRCFASGGTECPNLSKAFQVWWRRSFVKSSVEGRR